MVNKVKKIRMVAGGVIVNPKKQILLVQGSDKKWYFPNGGVENGETFLDAAEREIKEEAGVGKQDLKLIKEFPAYTRPHTDDENIHKQMHMFLFKSGAVKVGPQLEFKDEIIEARWVKKDEVVNLLSAPKDKEFFLKVSKEI